MTHWSVVPGSARTHPADVLAVVLNTLADDVIVISENLTAACANDRATALLGLHPDHVTSATCLAALSAWRVDDSDAHLRQVAERREPWAGIVSETSPDGDGAGTRQ